MRRTQAVIWVQVTKWYDSRAPPTELSDLNCGGLGIRTPCRTLSPLALPFARPPLAVMVGLAPTFHVVLARCLSTLTTPPFMTKLVVATSTRNPFQVQPGLSH